MRIRQFLVLLFCLVISISIARANDPPHNIDSDVDCGDCHGDVLFSTDPGSMTPEQLKDAYNTMCKRCHTSASGSYHGTAALTVGAHNDTIVQGSFTFVTSCIDCHHPHYQSDQFWWGRKYNGSEYRLFTGLGSVTSTLSNPTRTVITYNPASLSPKSGSSWDTSGPPDNDVEVGLANLASKTSSGRGGALLPNTASPYNSHMIESIDTTANTITVKGTVSTVATAGFAIAYGNVVKREIPYPTAAGKTVILLDKEGQFSFAHNDGLGAGSTDSTVTGICQVCHTQTGHWRQTPDAARDNHYSGQNCMNCHQHLTGFKPNFVDHYDVATPYVTDYTGGSEETCVSCHTSPGTYNVDRDYVSNVHNITCAHCHIDFDSPPTMTGGSNGSAVGRDGSNTCSDCHGATGGYNYNTDFAGAHDVKDHDGLVGRTGATIVNNCNYCHTGDIVNLDATPDVHNDNCLNCHANTGNDGSLVGVGSNGYGTTVGHVIGATSSCADCHAARDGDFSTHTHSNASFHASGGSGSDTTVAQNNGSDFSQNGSAASDLCSNCHNNGGDLSGWDDIYIVHNSSCNTCHNATRNTSALAPLYSNGESIQDVIADAAYTTGSPANCGACHRDKITSLAAADSIHGDHKVNGWVDGAGTTCVGCHDQGGNDDHDQYINVVHQGDCSNCHTDPAAGDYSLTGSAAGHAEDDPGFGSPNKCTTCHTAYGTDFETHSHGNATNHKTGGSGTTVVQGGGDVSQESGTLCSICHQDKSGGATTLTTWDEVAYEHDLDGTKDGVGSCVTCHNANRDVCSDGAKCATGVNTVQDIIAANTDPTNCAACHAAKIDSLSSDATHGGHDDSQFAWAGGCENCHGAGAAAEAVVSGIHANDCDLCHTTGGPYNAGTNKVGANGDGDATKAEGDAGTWTSTCTTCHNQTQVPGFHGIAISEVTASHQLSSDTSGGIDCEECHTGDAANEQLNTHMDGTDTPAQCATICHGRTTPSNTSGIVAKTVINDVTFNDPAPNNNDTSCEDCHAAKGDYKLHGLSDDDSVADGIDDGTGGVVWHNNLGSSSGAWADSGNTIPSTRTAGYTGKIDTANALIDDDYNCADCHDAQRTSFTSLEAMQVHTFNSGSGSGNCLTCHNAAMVSDEIDTGKGAGGTTIQCEDCHSIANGNGPSGEKMYQYDGVRHHKTVHAQAGNCTRCHADPRPADLSAEPGFAGTAAVNDGVIDSDGITWDDGFDDDFGLNYTHPGGIPTQMGCRLCHSNYETYTVDVLAEDESGADPWDTTEQDDLHGYNKTPPAHGLTIYANDFDARGTSLTYQDSSNLHEIRGAHQTTQVALASHRIDANDGSSKIEVFNYGACFACHTVQIRHAAPVPDQDYDTPVVGYTATERNTHPYDTLRYSPGRSVFNDFRGTGGDAWDDHRKPGGFPGWNTDWPSTNEFNRRGGRVFTDAHSDPSFAFYDDIDNYSSTSLAAVPVNANVNDLESLPGMTGPYNIRNFDTGPSAPNIDDITITVADWTGSAVYVEATSSIGSGQSFSFTFTGAGGPCNTVMTWDTDHYEGTCSAASGYTGSDTVTVSNNTTSASDERTTVLTDLTINPSTPVLTSITLADNDDTDPLPADPGFTNDDAGEVEVTIVASNYPTEMRISESSDFNGDTDPWILYDAIVTFTFSNTTNEEKTVYCQVRNGAGVSVDTRSNTIVLDTIPPTIESGPAELPNTLTVPNGHVNGYQAEFWETGSSQTITWTAGDITDANLKANPIFLKESYTSGDTWRIPFIASNEANGGSFDWTVGGSPITTARIRLDARDKAGNVASDASDNDYNKSTPYIVTNTDDSGAGSLRDVLQDLIDDGGNHSLWFDIPVADLTDGVAVISLTTVNLSTINTDDIYIEGATQTALRGDTNSKGPEVRIDDGNNLTAGFTISGGVFNHIRDLQITGFSTGVSSTGFDTVLERNHFGFSSGDTGGYASSPNGTNANLSDDYPVIEQNYFGCASSTGLNISGTDSAMVDNNVFGLFPDPADPAVPGATCGTTGTYAIYIAGAAADASISNNIISGSTYGIFLGGTSAGTTVRGNQIGVYVVGGIHDGGNNVTVLEDTTASWTVDNYVGKTLRNTTDGSSGTIISNTATTITVDSLTGGTDNDWDTDDTYIIWITAVSPTYNGVRIDTTGGDNMIGGPSVASADDNLLNSNVIKPGNSTHTSWGGGIYVKNAADDTADNFTKIHGNFIGTNPECDYANDQSECEVFSGGRGIMVYASGLFGLTIGGGDAGEAGNVIANMSADGVMIRSSDYVEITRNVFFNNGNDTGDDAIVLDPGYGGNYEISRPVIDSATPTMVRVSGISDGEADLDPLGDIVEVYIADFDGTEYGEGLVFVGSAQVVFGETYVDVPVSGVSGGQWVTATRTNHYPATPRFQTSPFSANARVPGPAVPALDWTGEAGYTTDGVNPESALSGSNFEFRVNYTDEDNDPPAVIEVWIDENDNLSYEPAEKYVMTWVDDGGEDYTTAGGGEIYTVTRAVSMAGDNTLNYRFYATDGISGAGGSPTANKTLTIQPCVNLDVDPNGTYFEAEDFTSTIVQGSSVFVLDTSTAGYNGDGFLRGSPNFSYATPPTLEGKRYTLNFPTAGTYKVWIRGNAVDSNWDSSFVGLDGSWTGEITDPINNVWEWSNTNVAAGSITIDVSTAGPHTFNVWIREKNHKLDAIYLVKDDAPTADPSDTWILQGRPVSGVATVYPNVCFTDNNPSIVGVATAVGGSTSIDVSMPYTMDGNSSNTYTVDYKLSSEPVVWTNWVTGAGHVASPYTTTITGLIGAETYDVRMTYIDADSVGGPNPQTVSGILIPVSETTAGSATATMANSTSIDLSMPYTFDTNGNNTYTVDYKLNSLPDIPANWTNWVTAATHTASPYTDTITSLTPGQSYDVRMTYNDADTVNGTNPQTVLDIILPSNVTTVGTATATMANHVSIDVSMPYTGDGNSNNTYTVDYKLNSLPDIPANWTNWVTAATHTASPYITTILPLTPTESYDVRMTYNDADTVSGTNPQTVSGIVLPSTPSYVVTNTNDSGAGSLRQELTDMINGGGYATLTFNIPGGLLTNGVAVINVPTALPQITAANITIDGSSQTSNVGDTNPYGPEVLIDGPGTASVIGFDITGTGTGAIIKDLQIVDFLTGIQSNGDDTQILGNYFGYTVNDTPTYVNRQNRYSIRIYGDNAIIGGDGGAINNPNYITNGTGTTRSIEINTATNTKIFNNVIGMRSDNILAANEDYGIFYSGSSSGQIGDNVFIGSPYGIYMTGTTNNNVIKGNTFGVYYNAGIWNKIGGQTIAGIRLSNGNGNIIGGSTVATDDATLNDSNVFDPDTNDIGIWLYNPTDYGTEILGNFIGTNPEQDETFGGRYGIQIDYPTGVTIDGNVIANMSIYGVWLQFAQANYVQLSQNSFYNNGNNSGDDAIYLNGTSNNSIARPIIDSATTTTVSVSNVFGGDGANLAGDIVEVYIADFTGTEYGEGKTFVTSAVVPYGSGVDPNDTVNVDVTGLVSSGDWLTVTRTNHNTATPSYQTSAFSANVQVP